MKSSEIVTKATTPEIAEQTLTTETSTSAMVEINSESTVSNILLEGTTQQLEQTTSQPTNDTSTFRMTKPNLPLIF